MKLVFKILTVSIVVTILTIFILLIVFNKCRSRCKERLSLLNRYENANRNNERAFLSPHLSFKLSNFPIYYINLDRSIERRVNFFKDISRVKPDVSITRISAIDGKNIKSKAKGKIQDMTFECKMNHSETVEVLACTLSHLSAIYTAYHRGEDIALILEDDASLDLIAFWPKTLGEIVNAAPPDAEIIHLYSPKITLRSPNSPSFTPFHVEEGHWHTVAYVINRQGMKSIMKNCFPDPDQKHAILHSITKGDRLPADYFIYTHAKTYVFLDFPTIIPSNAKNSTPSTIHTSHFQVQLEVEVRAREFFTKKKHLNK